MLMGDLTRGRPMVEAPPNAVTRLLIEWSNGDKEALKRLMPLVYDELRRVASRQLRHERRDHTLQPTALVHEAYLKLIDQRRVRWQNRAQFFGVASRLIRRIVVDHARRRHAAKRGGGLQTFWPAAARRGVERNVDVLALDAALARLGALDLQQARVVELRFFGGLDVEETAEVLGISTATVKRDWRTAKAWLYREMQGVA
jgi:RNA polymerase sigma factor (TIGR02999 family)